ncbi:hypothetical protein IL992_42700 [Microbispora sp. NEAU-D428]|uniref:hypothetical protein n=1 Tax=Microbispora sitophila TaxID=2771537 RepID=UPI001866BDF4|nr:hypothetical protein [Microbispora sitophila]MBE3015829.1 hypothetical protein [Microbispora sitophila]
MERNTFPVSAYISAPSGEVLSYLKQLKNLDEWTLFSRMRREVDPHTWIGTASAYQTPLYYHLKEMQGPPFDGIEWHCGMHEGQYYQVYPVHVIPADYAEPGASGVYLHWTSFLDPARATPMLSAAVAPIHSSEIRSLKSILERRAGHRVPAIGSHRLRTASIYVDAPLEAGMAYLSDPRNIPEWTHRLRPAGSPEGRTGHYLTEYDQRVRLTLTPTARPFTGVIEYDAVHESGETERAPFFLYSCAYAFSVPDASGFILLRTAFQHSVTSRFAGKQSMDDYRAELVNAKRLIETAAGNFTSFAQGPSYFPADRHDVLQKP